MSISPSERALARARALLESPLDYDGLLDLAGPQGRPAIERHVQKLDAEPDPAHARLWQRLAATMMKLAPHRPKFTGGRSIQYYIPDGKYRMQVYALEDPNDGSLRVYCADVLEQALALKLLVPGNAAIGGPDTYLIKDSLKPLQIQQLDNKINDHAACFKDMLGWNRRAMRITLSISVAPQQVEAAELLCALAAPAVKPATTPASTAGPAPGADGN